MTLRWGFLGASSIGRRALAPAVLAAPGHALDAVGARDLARAREFAAEFNIPKACGTYQEIVEDPALDVIYVALPNDAHAPWTIAALEAGKHVLCEKPLALSAADNVSGFSHSTCLPASSAAIVHGAWASLGSAL